MQVDLDYPEIQYSTLNIQGGNGSRESTESNKSI